MFIRSVVICLLLVLAACADRGHIAYGPPAAGTTEHAIWAVNFRPTEGPRPGQSLAPRPDSMRFERHVISVPPGHQTGHIEWPEGTPDAAQNFVTLESSEYADIGEFARHIGQSGSAGDNEIFLFVHGYNYTHGEAVYQLAQIAHDFELPAQPVLFSWPSAGKAVGYLYDRDSALIARDQLARVITALSDDPRQRLVILGHSMGNLLVVETLRQMAIAGRVDIAKRVDALIMVSPDIDGELFYSQASRITPLPDPTVLLATSEDRVLRLSAMLTGRTNRLGSAPDRAAVRDLPIKVIDAGDLGNGGAGHSVALTSPAAIAILKNTTPETLPGDQADLEPVKLSGLR
ncbi:putative lipoprotein [Sulfitobacter noctilucae]|uniref:alpha/beta hydrolase n=1 Tax=Sulfitobacter noctilucae TaxID=1342302 RepID=UPI000469D9DF|nr:alpha/beta fold hydrolase [Sulfitobacter noctilucae]KIN66217.1 putative lipoprotein [Sulfitobacter noctilucae]